MGAVTMENIMEVLQNTKNRVAVWSSKATPGTKLQLKKMDPYVYSSTIYNSHDICCYSVTQLCLSLCDPMDCSSPGFPDVLHHLPELAQTHVYLVGDAIQPSCPLLSPSPPAFNLSQHQGLQMSQFFASVGQNIGVSASTSVLPVNTQTDLL